MPSLARHLRTLYPAGAVFYNSGLGTSRLPVRRLPSKFCAALALPRRLRIDWTASDDFHKEPFAFDTGQQVATSLASNFTLFRHGGGHAVGLGLFLLSATLASRNGEGRTGP